MVEAEGEEILQEATRTAMSRELLGYYRDHGRSLPWRGDRDLYRCWVAEVMLQQTGVGTVIPYWQRFVERFPTVAVLAEATLPEVLGVWQGLGYYRRAIHLHRGAGLVVASGGRLPEDEAGWLALPGVGRSTAAGILAAARGHRLAVLDGNVQRVLSRVLAVGEPLASGGVMRRLWRVADGLTPAAAPGDYAQAIMDLGATVCTLRLPACMRCPWRGYCRGWASGSPERYPVRSRPVKRPCRYQLAWVLVRGDQAVVLGRRGEGGWLPGMWEVPSTIVTASWSGEVSEALTREWGGVGARHQVLPVVRHAFTHFHLVATPLLVEPDQGWTPPFGWHWTKPGAVAELPMATLHRKILARALVAVGGGRGER